MTKTSQTALITGAAKRIGRAMAENLAKKGYNLVISYNNSKKEAEILAQNLVKKYQIEVQIAKCDLRDLEQTKQLAEFMKKNHKNWNLLINNASIFQQSKFTSGSEKDFSSNFNIHLFSPLILAQEFAKVSAKNAQIINMIDKNIARFDTSYFHYLLSKKSLADATKMLSLQLAPKVRVNGIAPGFILSAIDGKNSKKLDEKIIAKIPLQKKGEIENICQALDFLLENQFVNGQIIFVDGGASLNHAG